MVAHRRAGLGAVVMTNGEPGGQLIVKAIPLIAREETGPVLRRVSRAQASLLSGSVGQLSSPSAGDQHERVALQALVQTYNQLHQLARRCSAGSVVDAASSV